MKLKNKISKLTYLFALTVFATACNKRTMQEVERNSVGVTMNPPKDARLEFFSLKKKTTKSDSINQFKEKFTKILVDYMNQNNNKAFDITKGKDIIVVLGNTGAGKSTLLNLLIGNELKIDGHKYVCKNNEHEAFKIGHEIVNSKTLFPKIVEIEDKIYVDLPGLCDSRGEEVDFMNAVCIKNILTKAKSVKFLLFTTEAAFAESRGQSFKQLLNKIKNILEKDQFSSLADANLLIVTKSHLFDKATDFYNEFLSKFDIKDIFNDEDNVILFHNPKSKKVLETNFKNYQAKLKEDIEEGIDNLEEIEIKKINIHHMINENLKKNIEKTCMYEAKTFIENFIKKYRNYNIKIFEAKLNQELIKLNEKEFIFASFIKKFDEKFYGELAEKIRKKIKRKKKKHIDELKHQKNYKNYEKKIENVQKYQQEMKKNYENQIENIQKYQQEMKKNYENQIEMKKNYENQIENQQNQITSLLNRRPPSPRVIIRRTSPKKSSFCRIF